MIYEYRRYQAMPGKMSALKGRFEQAAIPIWERHQVRPVAFWEPIVGDSHHLHYVLEWESMAERESAWSAFQADADWRAARMASEADGPLTAYAHNEFWRPSAFFRRPSMRQGK